VKLTLQQLSLPGAMLARCFWLYVWEVTAADGTKWLYIGRTGDSSSPNAQSPFVRLSQHLGQNPKSNALRRNLVKAGVDVGACRSFKLTACGPILAEQANMERHRPLRDKMAALEKGLSDALELAGYLTVNKVNSHKPMDQQLLRQVLPSSLQNSRN
jgi:hypothetical protein